MLEINGVQLNFDLMDAEIADAAEKALADFSEKHKTIERGKSLSKAIQQECDLVYVFFVDVFGKGAAEEVFKGEKHYIKCCDAFKQVVDEIQHFNTMLAERNQEMERLTAGPAAVDGSNIKRFETK